ncbi:MAG: hypothetical protein KME19_17145 [Microcoleus vaginatus WJT46-NPBG5]|nr:hypothetical protein [Microcoleus vaginatus WJT46-NPBG5]
MSEKFKPLDEHEVVCFKGEPLGRELNLNSNGFIEINLTALEFNLATRRRLNVSEQIKNKLFGEGIECYALKYKADGWESGKIRVKMTVEFCPDEPEVEETPAAKVAETGTPESPLDEIRQMIKEENQ